MCSNQAMKLFVRLSVTLCAVIVLSLTHGWECAFGRERCRYPTNPRRQSDLRDMLSFSRLSRLARSLSYIFLIMFLVSLITELFRRHRA